MNSSKRTSTGCSAAISVLGMGAFRVTRNSNLYLEEEESRTVLESVAEELHNRRKGDVVRMEIDAAASGEIVERLQPELRTRSLAGLSRPTRPSICRASWTSTAR